MRVTVGDPAAVPALRPPRASADARAYGARSPLGRRDVRRANAFDAQRNPATADADASSTGVRATPAWREARALHSGTMLRRSDPTPRRSRSPRNRAGASTIAAALLALATLCLAGNHAFADQDPYASLTSGGAVPNGRIVRVTTLADTGEGSLRAALSQSGPRVVVFDVGGEIELRSDLRIGKPQVTVAGQTAPSPGIHLTGASFRVRASDVVIEHLTVRPGNAGDRLDIRDGITIGGGEEAIERVEIRNVSVSWSVDELMAVAKPTAGPVAITHSILAEALRQAGHPKGEHSMGLLVRDAPRGVSIAANLFVSNVHRNPVVARNANAMVVNNWIVNPRFNAMHVYLKDAPDLVARFIGNVATPGYDTRYDLAAVQFQPRGGLNASGAQVIDQDNLIAELSSFDLRSPPRGSPSTGPMPARSVPSYVLTYAGSRPAERSDVDRRIIEEVLSADARVRDGAPVAPPIAPAYEPVRVIDAPFEGASDGRLRVEHWLEGLSVAVGAAPRFSVAAL